MIRKIVASNRFHKLSNAFKTFNEECEKVTEEDGLKLLGSYAGSYIRAFKKKSETNNYWKNTLVQPKQLL